MGLINDFINDDIEVVDEEDDDELFSIINER
jgi:hypothetical protein